MLLQVAALGRFVDIAIARLSHPAPAASSTASVSPSAPSQHPSKEADEAQAKELLCLKASLKEAQEAAAAAAEGQAYAAERLIEADQRLIELEAERDEVMPSVSVLLADNKLIRPWNGRL